MTGRPLRVLQVIGTLSMGGAETWLVEMLRHWSRVGGVQLDFLVTSGAAGVLDGEISALGGKIHYIRYGRGHMRTFVRDFRRLLRDGRYDAIHDHTEYASGWHYLLGLGQLPPVRVTHIHNTFNQFRINYELNGRRRLAGRLGKVLTGHLATHVCGTSAQALRDYGYEPGLSGKPAVSVLHCGFDIGAFSAPREPDRASVLNEFGLSADTTLVFHAGRLDYQLESNHPRNHKNTWFVVEVAREALRRNPSVVLLIAGAGVRQREQLETKVAAWGLSDHVRFLGVRPDMGRLMRAADTVLFPSTEEGLGMVAVEGQAAGTPVLASTGVPREACINPALFHALPLSEPLPVWADKLLALAAAPRLPVEECRAVAESSPFSIVNSARALETVYRGERL